MELGERIKKERRLREITQYQLAEFLNVSQPAVAAWEKGHRKPDIDSICKMADLFETTTDSLLGRVPMETEIIKPTPKDTAQITKDEERLMRYIDAQIEKILKETGV